MNPTVSLQQNLDLIKQLVPKSFYDAIDAINDKIELKDSESSGLCVFHDDQPIFRNIAKELSASLSSFKSKPNRVLVPRLQYDSEKAKNLQQNIIFDASHGDILASLQSSSVHQPIARTLFILGSLHLTNIDAYLQDSNIIEVVVLESDIVGLCTTLRLVDLPQLIANFKLKKIGLSVICESSERILKARIIDHIRLNSSLSINGILFTFPALQSPILRLLARWFQDPQGYTNRITGLTGSDIDEFAQLSNAYWNVTSGASIQFISKFQPNIDLSPALIIASGPSLDLHITWLRENHHKFIVYAVGSALGTLLANNIKPDFLVFLERSETFKDSISELIANDIDISDIPLIASISVDPLLPLFFSSTYYFLRPYSVFDSYFGPAFNDATLLQAGPVAANAALEVSMHLGHRHIYTLGVDCGAAESSKARSGSALGKSSRIVSIPIAGRSGNTVFTSSELNESRLCIENAIINNNSSVYSLPFGAAIDGLKVLQTYDELPLDIFSCDKHDSLSQINICLNNRLPLSPQYFTSFPDTLRDNFLALFEAVNSCIDNAQDYSVTLHRDLSQLLATKIRIFDDENWGIDSSDDNIASNLCMLTFLYSVQPIYDSYNSETFHEACKLTKLNLSYLQKLYSSFLDTIESYSKYSSKNYPYFSTMPQSVFQSFFTNS